MRRAWSYRSLTAIAGVWTVIASLSAATTVVARTRVGLPPRTWDTITEASIVCLIYAALTPFALSAGLRWKMQPPYARAVAIHSGLAALYWLASAGATLLGSRVLASDFTASASTVLTSSAFGALLAYVVTVGLAHAIDVAARLRDQERQLTEARLQALTGQLRPHFLFNALNAVATLVARDPAGAQRLILDLSALLRMSLDRRTEGDVPLRDELEFAKAYLAVMRARIGDRLRVTWDVPEDLHGAYVPQLFILPLVENALKHGIARDERAGAVYVRAAREGRSIRLTVTDDGPGPGHSIVEGFGLATTRLRLTRQFGRNFELSVRGAADRGTAATVRVPLRLP